MDSSFISAEWSVTSLFLFLSQSSTEIATIAIMMINIATVARIIGIFLFLLSALSSCVSLHAFSVSKGAPVLQEEEALGFMVAEGVVGVDEAPTGCEENEGDSRGTGVDIAIGIDVNL